MSAPTGLRTAVITGTGTGDNVIVAAVTGLPLRIWGIMFTAAGAVNVVFKDGASTALSGAEQLTAAGSSVTMLPDATSTPYFYVSPGNAFIINSSGAVALTGTCWYSQG